MATGRLRCGRCAGIFWLAVIFDLGGIALLLLGIFANLQVDGRSFGEFLIYSGGIVVFFSLLWWLAWYSGNLEISLEDLQKEIVINKRSNFMQLARKFSESFSKRKRRRKTSLPAAGNKDVALDVGPGPLETPNLPGEPLYSSPPGRAITSISANLDSHIFLGEDGSKGHLELSALSRLDNQFVIIPWPKEDRLV
ncbi:uncharacterized protein LOC144767430 [Lissotriton helveticus]